MTGNPKDRPTMGNTGDDSAPPPATPGPDPLRRSILSKTWIGLGGFAVVLLLITDFVLQNTNSVRVSFLFWHWRVPLAVALIVAVAGGILVTSLAGTVRIWQLRRRVRRDRKDR
ncbi:MAG: LapA family protein [Marmoricola sp.]